MMPGKARGGYVPGELTETMRAEESRTIKLAAVKEIITLRGEIAELKRENERLRDRRNAVHRIIHQEASGALLFGVCACGAQLNGSGITNWSTVFSKHIRDYAGATS